MRQRRNDFGVRVGRDAQKGNVGVHHYCFLLGQRVGEGGRRMLGRGAPRMGALGLAPPHPRCRWEPLQPSPMAVGIIKAETRGEAAGRRGCSSELSPQMDKIQRKPDVEGERDGKQRELSPPQTPDPRLVV